MRQKKTRFRFSHKSIDALPPQPAECSASNYEMSDEVEVGLRIAVYKSGRKSFRHRYTFRGRKGVMTLGEYPAVNVELARELVRENKRLIMAQDIDPKEERLRTRQAISFAEFCNEHYMPYAESEQRGYKDVENRIRLRLIPTFGNMSLTQIGKRHVSDFHRKIREEVSAVSANRYLSQISGIYSRAIMWGYATENPAQGIQKFRENGPRTRYLDGEELERFTRCLWEEAEKGDQSAKALMLMLVTGQRKTAVLSIRKEHVDIAKKTIFFPKTKNGRSYYLPLNSIACQLLEKILAEGGASPWVFPSRTGKGPQKDIRKTFGRVCKKAKVENLRPHDLRRSFASGLASKGVSAMVIRDLLCHRDVRTTQQVYAHLNLGSLREACEVVSDEISAVVG